MVGCVLMASGAGRRFGSNKLLSAVEGVPLHRRAMAALAPAGFGRLVVCSPYPEVLSAGAEHAARASTIRSASTSDSTFFMLRILLILYFTCRLCGI